jgi:hypothetical protein
MIYEYRYRDGEEEYFELDESIKDLPKREHNGRPCFRVIRTTNFVKKGLGWAGMEAKGAYTTVGVDHNNKIKVLK